MLAHGLSARLDSGSDEFWDSLFTAPSVEDFAAGLVPSAGLPNVDVITQHHLRCALPGTAATKPQPLQAPAPAPAAAPRTQPCLPPSAAPVTPPCMTVPGRALPRSPFDCGGSPFGPARSAQLLAPAAAHAAVPENSEALSWLSGWSRLASEGSPRSVASSPASYCSAGSPFPPSDGPLADAGSFTPPPRVVPSGAPLRGRRGVDASRHSPRPASPSPERPQQHKRQRQSAAAPPAKRHAAAAPPVARPAAAQPPAACAAPLEPPAWLLEGLPWDLRQAAVQAWFDFELQKSKRQRHADPGVQAEVQLPSVTTLALR